MEAYKYVPNQEARRIFNHISHKKDEYVTFTAEKSISNAIGKTAFNAHVKSGMPKRIGRFKKKLFTNDSTGYKHIDSKCIGTIQKVNV